MLKFTKFGPYVSRLCLLLDILLVEVPLFTTSFRMCVCEGSLYP